MSLFLFYNFTDVTAPLLCDHGSVLGEQLQSDYRPYHSTESALSRVKNDILRSLDNNKAVPMVMLDIMTAFNTMDHSIFLNRLTA